MRLQKMKHKVSSNGHEVITHAINLVTHGREFTICGLDTVSSDFNYNEFEKLETHYDGKLKEVNCEECLELINFIKKLK